MFWVYVKGLIGADITYFNGLTLSVFRLISAWVNPLGVRSSGRILRINY